MQEVRPLEARHCPWSARPLWYNSQHSRERHREKRKQLLWMLVAATSCAVFLAAASVGVPRLV